MQFHGICLQVFWVLTCLSLIFWTLPQYWVYWFKDMNSFPFTKQRTKLVRFKRFKWHIDWSILYNWSRCSGKSAIIHTKVKLNSSIRKLFFDGYDFQQKGIIARLLYWFLFDAVFSGVIALIWGQIALNPPENSESWDLHILVNSGHQCVGFLPTEVKGETTHSWFQLLLLCYHYRFIQIHYWITIWV